MNKTKYLALAFAALTLGACTSDDVAVNDDPNIAQGGEKGYVSLAINLPTQPSTRVADDGESVDLDDGTENEYAVKSGILVLFTGENEAAATCVSAYTLNVDGFQTQLPENDQITSKATLVEEVAKPSTTENENIYALVILNPNSVVTVDGTSLKIKGAAFSGTFKELTEKAVSISAISEVNGNGFLMSNAPLYSAVGGVNRPADGASASTLAVMDKDKFYTNPTTATSNPAATIYVERAVAKVTVTAEDAKSVSGGNSHLVGYAVAGWTLDVTNKKTYLVRNVACTPSWWQYANESLTSKTIDKYRFVGSTPVETGKYRTYWGKDPNYSGEITVSSEFNNADGVIDDNDLETADGKTPLYCLENTFNTQNMNNDQTTRVILKAKLKLTDGLAEDDGSFYVLDDHTETIYTENGIKDEVKTWVQAWINANKTKFFTAGTIEGTDLTVTLSTTTTDEGGYIDVTKVEVNTSIEGITWVDGQSPTELNSAIASNLETIIGDHKIGYYKNGYSYYEVRIKHFGDSQTPWTSASEEGSYGSTTTGENNWLGRWGVLRNNWYDLTISVKSIGSPEVPDVTNKPDDPEDLYVAVTINVLSWAKRETQDVEL